MRAVATLSLALAACALAASPRADEGGGDLGDVRRRGVLRHLAVPSAGFVAAGGDGLEVELVREFARRLGLGYQLVRTDWPDVVPDLLGRRTSGRAPDPARGDVVASGRTLLPWRSRAVAFSAPILSIQVWVVAVAGSEVQPVRPSGSLEQDVAAVRASLAGRRLLGLAGTCLDPALHRLARAGALPRRLGLPVDELAAALIQGEGELALLDVAGAMAALRRYPGRIKVIGPASSPQAVVAAFRPGAPQLRAAFDLFLAEARRDGTLDRLVERYFPEAQGSAELLGGGR